MKKTIKAFYNKEWTMEEKVLFTAAAVLGGIVIGFIVAPFKSICCGNNNGEKYYFEDMEEGEK